MPASLEFKPLSVDTWQDLEQLFGARGACGGCWCMHWRQTNKEYENCKGEQNKKFLHDLARRGKTLGVIAYLQGNPIGWCSVSPRSELVRLETSRLFKPIDEKPVWSITCLFVQKEFRRRGLSSQIIEAACSYAADRGAEIIESYPVIPQKDQMPDVFAFTGTARAFEKAGFQTVAEPSEKRRIMRWESR